MPGALGHIGGQLGPGPQRSLRSEAESSGSLALPNVKTARSWRGIVTFTHLAREGRMTVTIARRELLAALGGAAVAWPLAARAQQPSKLPTIGFLGATNPSIESQRVAAFVLRLRELGWIDSRNLAIEYRWSEGRNERYAENAAEFVRLKVDVIVTQATPPTLAAKQATAVAGPAHLALMAINGDDFFAPLHSPGTCYFVPNICSSL